MMQLSIYWILALVALSAAKPFDCGHKVSKETFHSSDSSKSSERYATKGIILYLTPSEIEALQATKSEESSIENKKEEQQLSLQDYNDEQHQNAWSQYYKLFSENKALQAAESAESQESSVENKKEEQQLTLQGYNDKQQQNEWSQYYNSLQTEEPKQEWQNAYYSKDKPVFENQADSVDAYNFNFEQNTKEHHQNIKNEEERQESEWIPFNNAAAKKQEEALLQDQLQQHWNRILNHNRAQLRSLSAIGKEQLNSDSSTEGEQLASKWQSASRNQENIKSDIEKQIEFILKEASDFEKQSNGNQADHINHRPIVPIVIHKEVRVTKHYKVPVVEKVKVPVPRPVLVPIPEPYEVKVPHPYPVPVEIVKHIPVPVIKTK